jgi:hypothetical protein
VTVEKPRSRLSCFWIGLGLLTLCSCAAAGIGRLADRGVPHASDYSVPLLSYGLLTCLCLVAPALVIGLGLGLAHGRRLPELTAEEIGSLEAGT